MKKKYFDAWFFVDDKFAINKEDAEMLEMYFEFEYNSILDLYIGRRCFRGVLQEAYYYGGNIDKIKEYHNENLPSLLSIRIVERLAKYAVKLSGYEKYSLTGIEIYNFNEKYKETKKCVFNEQHELQQYTETFYDEKGEIRAEKVFFPSIWKIHEE
jgi:hypothetical protein